MGRLQVLVLAPGLAALHRRLTFLRGLQDGQPFEMHAHRSLVRNSRIRRILDL